MNATIQEIEGIDDYWGPAFRSVYEGEGHDAFVQQLDDRIVQHDKEIEKLCNFHYQPKKRRRQRGSRQTVHLADVSTEDHDRQKSSEHHQHEASLRSHNSQNCDVKKQLYNLPDEVVQVYSAGDDRYGPKRRRIDPKRLGGYSDKFPITTHRAATSNSYNIGDSDKSNDVNEDTDDGSCYDGYTDGTPELDDFESSKNWEEASAFDENQKTLEYDASVNQKKQMSPSKNEAHINTASDLRLYLRNRNRCRDTSVESRKTVESPTSERGGGRSQRGQLIQDQNASSDRKSGRSRGSITELPHRYKDKNIHSNDHVDNHVNFKHQLRSRMDALDERQDYNTTSRQSRCESYKSYSAKCNEHADSSQRLPENKRDLNTSNDLRSYLRSKVTEVEGVTITSQTCETKAYYHHPRSDSPNRPKSIDSDAHCSNSSQHSLSRLENVAYRENPHGSTEHYVSLTRPSKQHIYKSGHAFSERSQRSHNPSTENYHGKTRHSSADIYFDQNHPSSAQHHNQQSRPSSNHHHLEKNRTVTAESKVCENSQFQRFSGRKNTQSRPSSAEYHTDDSRHVSNERYRDKNSCLSDEVHGKITPGYTKRCNSQSRPLSANLYNDQNLRLPVEEQGENCHRMAEDDYSQRSRSIEDHISRELTGRYHTDEQPLSTERNSTQRLSMSSDLNLHENRRLSAPVVQLSEISDKFDEYNPTHSRAFSPELFLQSKRTSVEHHGEQNRIVLDLHQHVNEGRHLPADHAYLSDERCHASADRHFKDTHQDSAERLHVPAECHVSDSGYALTESHYGESSLASAERHFRGHESAERYHVDNRHNMSADRHYTRRSHSSTERYYDSNKEVSTDSHHIKIRPVSHERHYSESSHASTELHYSDSRHASAELHYSDSRHASTERHHSDSRHASADRHYSDSRHASAERHHSDSRHASADRHYSDSRHASAERHYSDSRHASTERHYSVNSHVPAKRRYNNSRHMSAEQHYRKSSHTSAERHYGDNRQVSAPRPCVESHHLPGIHHHIENHASPVGIDSGSTSGINKYDVESTKTRYSQGEHQIIYNRATSVETVIVNLGPKHNIPHRQCITPDIDVKSKHTPIDVETQISTAHPQSHEEQCSLHETNVKIETNENTTNTETLQQCATPPCLVKVECPIYQISLTEEGPPTVTSKHLSSPSHSTQNPDTSLDVKCEIVDNFSNNVVSVPKTSTDDSKDACSKSQLNYDGSKLVDAHQPSPKEHHTPTLKESQHKLMVRDVDSIILLLKDAHRNPLDAVSSNNQTDACEIDQSKVSSDVPLVSTRSWFTPPKLTIESPNRQHTNSLNINNSDPRLRPRNKIVSSVEDSSGLQNGLKDNSKRKSNVKSMIEVETKHVNKDISLNPVQNSSEKLKNKLMTASLPNENSKKLILDISQTTENCCGSADECQKGPLSPDYEPNCILTRQQPSKSTDFVVKAAFDLPVFDPSNKAQTISDWITKVNEVAVTRKWTDQQVVEYAMSKLVGGAKQWFEGITYQFSWKEWQNELVTAFPSKENYGKILLDMLSTKCKVGDSLKAYYFEKIGLLNNCNIKGENAVECIIFGIEDELVRDKAEAENFKDPEKLLTFLMNLKKENAADMNIIYSDLLENP